MTLTLEECNDNLLVLSFPDDHLDSSNVSDLRKLVLPAIKERNGVAMDLSNLNFIDSSGLGFLIACHSQLGKDGAQMRLFGMTPPVQALFDLMRMHKIFVFSNTKKAAIESLETSTSGT